MDSSTIQLDLADVQSTESAMAHGQVPVSLSLSAYDVPREIVVEKDSLHNLLKIGFRYVDQEGDDSRDVPPDLKFLVGKNSGKILAIQLENAFRTGPVTGRLLEGVERLRQNLQPQRDNQRLNYSLIHRLIATVLEAALRDVK